MHGEEGFSPVEAGLRPLIPANERIEARVYGYSVGYKVVLRGQVEISKALIFCIQTA